MYTPDTNDAVEINNVTRLLCLTLQTLETKGHLDKLDSQVLNWFKEHKELDAQRKGE